jgi:hypothetical protein
VILLLLGEFDTLGLVCLEIFFRMRFLVLGTIVIATKGACPDIAPGRYRGMNDGREITVYKKAGSYTLELETVVSESLIEASTIEYSIARDCSLKVAGLAGAKILYDGPQGIIKVSDTFILKRL